MGINKKAQQLFGLDLSIPMLAIFWMAFLWLWNKTGLKSKNGLKYVAVGAVWLVFYSSFQVLSTFPALAGYTTFISNIGLYIGGGLAFLFTLIGTLTMAWESVGK